MSYEDDASATDLKLQITLTIVDCNKVYPPGKYKPLARQTLGVQVGFLR